MTPVSVRPAAAPSLLTLPIARVAAPPDYYAVAQGKQGVDLLRSLHDIVSRGQVDLGYDGARDALFGSVDDPTNSNSVTDIYTGRVISGISDRKTAFDKGLNTEHTWPQSQGATGIARQDLHQLQPADIDINGLRGHLPYGLVSRPQWTSPEVPGITERSRMGTDASGDEVFEPRPSVRGDIARGLLYFYMRYNTSRPADYSDASFRKELPTLLKWNHEDPVDDVEAARNDRIFNVEHNRNPFVDHPEWVDTVGAGWSA